MLYFCWVEIRLNNPVARLVAPDESGEFVIPDEVLQRHGLESGMPLVSLDFDEAFMVMSADRVVELIRASFRNQDPVGALLGERREEFRTSR